MQRLIFEEEHEMFRDSVRKFMQAEAAPHVERWREQGLIAWLDLSGGKGKRPTVSFTLDAVLQFERNCLMDIRKEEQ